MTWLPRGLRAACSIPGFSVLGTLSTAAIPAQPTPTVELPLASLESIAIDFESGRNRIYCYQRGSIDSATAVIHVDSITVVTTPDVCVGLGIGYISRIDDRPFLVQALRGLIDGNDRFRVVSAFYGIGTIEVNGQSIRAARALSVLRGGTGESARMRRESDSAHETH